MDRTLPERHSTPSDLAGRGILAILVLAMVGTLAELLLLEHYDGWKQWIPLSVLGLTSLSLGWQALRPSAASRRVLQGLMIALLVAGVAGVILHIQGNLEFELEMSPDASGWPLWLEVIRGATPALAPGSLIPFGLLGLLYASRKTHLLPQDS
jgi:hypothetical protein